MQVSIDIPRGKYFSVTDAAGELCLTTGRIRQMIRAGQVDAIKVTDRSWLLPSREVQRLKTTQRKVGRPKKTG